MVKVYGYKKCSTVLKAIKYLESKSYKIDFFDMVVNQIDKDVLLDLINKSRFNIDDFFNKNGILYKEMKLKDKLDKLNNDEKLKLLLSNGKMIKRPIIVIDNDILLGFNKEIQAIIGSK